MAGWEFSTAMDKGDAGGTVKDFFKLRERLSRGRGEGSLGLKFLAWAY